jgi:biofilm protein TabA
MILDHLSRSEKYYNIHTSFRHAFDYLKINNLSAMEDGKYEIEGDDIFLLLSHGTATDVPPKLESHKKYIDIQLTLDGSFPIGWKTIDRCMTPENEYNSEKDVRHYSDLPEFTVELTSEMFAIVFPEDVHAGLPPKQHVRKAVVKVAV